MVKVKKLLSQNPAGKATPAPPVGSTGQAGISIWDYTKKV